MRSDLYLRIVLTIIAACLVALTIHTLQLEPIVKATAEYNCKGELQANSNGGIKESTGGYHMTVQCIG